MKQKSFYIGLGHIVMSGYGYGISVVLTTLSDDIRSHQFTFGTIVGPKSI